MFQFPEFALPCLCIQQGMTLARRVSPFRNLRIKAYCQLPAAYRRLSRLSSPVIAKACTTCTYSLDPITLSPRSFDQGVTVFRIFNFYFHRIDLRIRLQQRFVSDLRRLISNRLDTIKNPHAFHALFHDQINSAMLSVHDPRVFTSSKFLKNCY